MNLHSEIMNIPISVDQTGWFPLEIGLYKYGHRDARHAAAELSLKYDSLIEDVLSACRAESPVAFIKAMIEDTLNG